MSTPSYLIQADNHNIASNADQSLLESVGEAASSVATFAGLSIAAGVNEIYNIVPTVGSWLGADTEQSKLEDRLAEYDTDLMKYYEDKKAGIDTTGFILGSFIPGLGGVKAVNVGQRSLNAAIQTGKFGEGYGKALGLLAPQREKHLSAAIRELGNSGNAFKMTEANTLRALGNGFSQNAIEAFAFETAVAATMHNSPFLDQFDASDMARQVAIGTALGGGIGGVIAGVISTRAIKQGLKGVQTELQPWSSIAVANDELSPMEKVLTLRSAIDRVPEVPAGFAYAERANAMRSDTISNAWTAVRAQLHEFAGKDAALAQVLEDAIRTMPIERIEQEFLNGINAGRVTSRTAAESRLAQIAEKERKGGIAALTPEEARLQLDTEVSYFGVHGTYAGKTLDERPPILSITDLYSNLDVQPDGVYSAGKLLFRHENNPHRPYNIDALSHVHTESRYLWAEKSAAWTEKTAQAVHENDLPLLFKAWRDLDSVKIIPEGKTLNEAYVISGKANIENFIKSQQRSISERLLARTVEPDPLVIRNKLEAAFGITLNVSEDSAKTGFLGRWTQRTVDGVRMDSIEVSIDQLRKKNIRETIRTLMHERGHMTYQAMLRGLTNQFTDASVMMRPGMSSQIIDPQMASVLDLVNKELQTISKRVRPGLWRSKDIGTKAYRTEPHELMADALGYFAQHPEQLAKFPVFNQYAGHLVRPIPKEVMDSLLQRSKKLTQEEIAEIVNVRPGYLTGTEVSSSGWNARDTYRAEYAASRTSKSNADPLMLPRYIKLVSNTAPVKDADGNLLQGMQAVAYKTKEFEKRARLVAASNIPELADMPEWRMGNIIADASEGPGKVSFADPNYGSAGSVSAYIGQRTHNLIAKAKESTIELLNPIGQRLGNDLKAAVEWSVLNERVRMSPYRYTLDTTGSKLVAKMSPEDFAQLQSIGDEWLEIPIKNANTLELASVHMGMDSRRLAGHAAIHNARGNVFKKDIDTFYPIPRSPKDTPHFAFVVDETAAGVGHNQMIYAKSGEDLEAIKQLVREQRPDLKIYNKQQSEEYFKSIGQYNYEMALNERLFDVTKLRTGTSAMLLPKTDPAAIVQETLDWHLAREVAYVRANVSHMYEPQFNALKAAGESLTASAKSKTGYVSAMSYAESAISNPPNDLVRMALDYSKKDQLPAYSSIQENLDRVVSEAWNKISTALDWKAGWSQSKQDAINEALLQAGHSGPLVNSESLYRATNGKIERGALSAFVNQANAMLSTFALRLDFFNSINNAVGSQVLLNTELRSLMKAIEGGDAAIAGRLADLAKITVPGTGYKMLSPTKMIAKAMGDFWTDEAGRAWAKQHGFTSSIMEQYRASLDVASAGIASGNMQKFVGHMKSLADKGETWTGNRIAEELNRYSSAMVAKQITDLAVEGGLITNREALTYINTFVNRTQGNYIAAQRPLIFQGPVGQAIGLFQTYQFNFIQQMLRHVGDRDAKTVLAAMGLQASLYGLQGLPAFNAINTHIIGNAPGNTEHTDVYKLVYQTAGKEAGDWLMYGVASNALGLLSPDLKNNLYVRGDLNPRHLTVVPTSAADIPIVGATSKVIGNMLDTASMAMKDVPLSETLLRGLEHNGVSRPLTGFAQIASGALNGGTVTSMNRQGNILMQHELASLASLTRFMGAKPLDEALIQDAMFRFNTYRAKDRSRRDSLGESVKLNIVSGQEIDQDALDGFAESYMKTGGNQAEFTSWMARQYRNVTIPQAEQLKNRLNSPYVSHLQALMGGARFQTALDQADE